MRLITLRNNLGKIFLFVLLFGILCSCRQGRMYKINAIIDSLGIVENQKYWYFDIRLETIKYEATKEDSLKLVEIANILTEKEIRKRVINSFDDVLTDNEINAIHNFITSSAYYKFFKSSIFSDNISNQFKDINEELDKIDQNIKNPNSNLKFEPIPIERENGFYVSIGYKANSESKDIVLEENPVITKADILECTKDNHEISIVLNKEGAKKFYLTTKNNIGKPIAIVIDKHIVSMPIVHSAISGGKVSITGNFTDEEIENMVIKLRND